MHTHIGTAVLAAVLTLSLPPVSGAAPPAALQVAQLPPTFENRKDAYLEQVDSVIGPGRLSNGFYQTFMKYTLEGDENAHKFSIHNALKDATYINNLGNSVGAYNPVSGTIRNSYAAMVGAGQGDRHLPMLADFIAHLNGLEGRGTKS